MNNKIILTISIFVITVIFIIGLSFIGKDAEDKNQNDDNDDYNEDVSDYADNYEGPGVDPDEISAGNLNAENQSPESNTAAEVTELPRVDLFVSATCPHCHNVLKYINDNDLKEKFQINEFETYNNQDNQEQLRTTANNCQLENYGVPLLWDGEECYVGSTQIIDFFERF